MIRTTSKRDVSDPMHPGAASLLYRSGIADQLRHRFTYPAKSSELRGAALLLLEAGIVDFEQHDKIRRAINRRIAADFLRQFRRAVAFDLRVALIRQLRSPVPAGFSSYAIRMGHHLKSRRRDLA